MNREYSKESRASAIFQDLLDTITQKGWFSAAPGGKDNLILYVSFHVYPGDADSIFNLIKSTLDAYQNEVKWVIRRRNENRFFLCPEKLDARANELDNFDSAYEEFLEKNDQFPRKAANSLIDIADLIYKNFQKHKIQNM